MVELRLPLEPLRGSKSVTTTPLPRLPLPGRASAPAGGASVTSGEGFRSVDGGTALTSGAAARIEKRDHDATPTAASARPCLGARRRRFGHVGEGFHLVPGHRAVRASP